MSDQPKLTRHQTENIRVTSSYGATSRLPLVNLAIGDNLFTWESDEAKRVGHMLIEVAMAAEADAFLFEWTETSLGNEKAAVVMLREFRARRERREARG